MRPKGSAAHLEYRRQLAGKLLAEGMSVRAIARLLAVVPGTVSRWRRALGVQHATEGTSQLLRELRPESLTEEQVERLRIIAAKCPVHRTLDGEVMFDERVERVSLAH